jgi:hypothetical protein
MELLINLASIALGIYIVSTLASLAYMGWTAWKS